MKIYTRTGDQGDTSLYGNDRVSKNDPRIAAAGAVDELNALLGVARASGLSARCDEAAEKLQHQLFDLGAELATPNAAERATEILHDSDIEAQEALIDSFEKELSPLRNFILPGGSQGAAHLHLVRCVCRRAEREVVSLHEKFPQRDPVLKFINRTSDLLFVLARYENQASGRGDVPWQRTR